MPSKKPQFVIRTEQETIDKIAYIAKDNERSTTQEIVYLIKKRIKEYENKNGSINVGDVSINSNSGHINIGSNNETVNIISGGSNNIIK